MNGILELLEMAPQEHLQIEYVFLSESVLLAEEDREDLEKIRSLALENKAEVVCLSQGEEMQDGKLRFSCLYPDGDSKGNSKGDRNNDSLVMLLEYQEFEMLFTGDVEEAGEQEIVEYIGHNSSLDAFGNDNRIDVLKVAHHGSAGSSCEEFLDVVQPKLSLISYGKNNSYGHPRTETLDRLENCGSKIMGTVDSGAITLKVNGRRVKVKEYRE